MQDFEQRICEKLKTENLEKVAFDCLQNIVQFSQAAPEEVEKTISFLIQFGFYHEVRQILLWLIDKNQIEIIWKYLGILISHNQVAPSVLQKLESWTSQQSNGFLINYFVDLPQFSKNQFWQQAWQNKISEQQLNKRKDLFEHVQSARNQSLFDEEEKALEKLAQMFPQDRQVKKENREFRERKAFELLDKYKSKKKYKQPLPMRSEDSGQLRVEHLAPELSIDFINEDLVVAALMLEDYTTAVDLINYLDDCEKNDWLKLEVLLLAERAVELLKLSFTFEKKYSLKAESYYACLYYRAQAYYRLDEFQKAINLMKEITEHNPNYRQSSQLLREWGTK